MSINVEQIARDIRDLNRTPEQLLLANLYLLDLDEFEVEPLAVHWESLCALGINFQSDQVQININAFTHNLEGAILYILDLNARIPFNNPEHATNTFVMALRNNLKPKK